MECPNTDMKGNCEYDKEDPVMKLNKSINYSEISKKPMVKSGF
jgi:hypothetical protein